MGLVFKCLNDICLMFLCIIIIIIIIIRCGLVNRCNILFIINEMIKIILTMLIYDIKYPFARTH